MSAFQNTPARVRGAGGRERRGEQSGALREKDPGCVASLSQVSPGCPVVLCQCHSLCQDRGLATCQPTLPAPGIPVGTGSRLLPVCPAPAALQPRVPSPSGKHVARQDTGHSAATTVTSQLRSSRCPAPNPLSVSSPNSAFPPVQGVPSPDLGCQGPSACYGPFATMVPQILFHPCARSSQRHSLWSTSTCHAVGTE